MTREDTPPACGTDDPSHSSNPGLDRRRFIVATGSVASMASVAGVNLAPAGQVEAAVPTGASRFEILPNAVRVADTRQKHRAKYDFSLINNRRIRVKVAGRLDVPANASAVVLTVTGVNSGARSHITVYPYGEKVPIASNLNLDPWSVNANMVTVKVGAGGRIEVASLEPGDKIIDILGYYVPVSAPVRGGRFITLQTPLRVYDSRKDEPTHRRVVPAGSFKVIDLSSLPDNASAAMINLTVAAPQGPGFFTALPSDAPNTLPTTSSVNASRAGDTRAAGVIVPIANPNKRRIKIYAQVGAFVIVDVFGFYTAESGSPKTDGLFVPVNPVRLMDTRRPGQMGRLWPGWVVEVPIPAAYRARAAAVAMNVTGVNSRDAGYLTVSGGRLPLPKTSNVNWTSAGSTVPNHAVSTLTTVGFQVFSSHGAFVLADMAGYFLGVPRKPSLPKFTNPPPPPAPPDWVLHVPRLGLTSTVKAGNPNSVTDSGYSWHWTGTGYVGQVAHVSLFAHRTEHGGPYRYLHVLQNGDTATLQTVDRRLFTYRMVRRDLVWGASRYGPPTANILAATRQHPGTTLSLIACTRTDWLPTSLNHRIVVTFELVSWREV